jgi:nucleotide-binding universal stress UspA family protein
MDGRIDQVTGSTVAVDIGEHRPRVVVGVDTSPGSRAALRYAFTAAARRGAALDVVTAMPLSLPWLPGPALDAPDVEAVRRDMQTQAQDFGNEVRDDTPGVDKVPTHVLVAPGPAAQVLAERAEGADLLVVGSRGHGAVRSALLGSVALHCLSLASCPVVVVHEAPNEFPQPARIVVGVDGSDESKGALRAALAEGRGLGAEVEVVVAYIPADYWTDPDAAVTSNITQLRSHLRQRADGLVHQVRSETATEGDPSVPTVKTVVVEGAASDVLLERSQGAQLLVVGTRGAGAIRGLLLGSVALHCAMHGRCPVLVVRSLADRPVAGAMKGGQR